jgi:hypothetical protein
MARSLEKLRKTKQLTLCTSSLKDLEMNVDIGGALDIHSSPSSTWNKVRFMRI